MATRSNRFPLGDHLQGRIDTTEPGRPGITEDIVWTVAEAMLAMGVLRRLRLPARDGRETLIQLITSSVAVSLVGSVRDPFPAIGFR